MTIRCVVQSARHRQQGVALFIALIAMVLLSLAGIALVRSVDTTTSVASNIAFRQGSIGPINRAIEDAIDGLFRSGPPHKIPLQNVNDLAHGYYAILQPGEQANGVPNVLAGDYTTMLAKYNGAGLPAVVPDPVTQMEVRSVIERVCNAMGIAAPGPWGVTIGNCDTLPPKVSPAGTDNREGAIPLPPIPNFRVTVRVDLPASNTVSHAQAFVR